jgi:hypothetical protein
MEAYDHMIENVSQVSIGGDHFCDHVFLCSALIRNAQHWLTVYDQNHIMNVDDNHKVKDVLEYDDSPSTQSGARDWWASLSQATSLPDFLSNQTMRSICTHQVHMAMLQANICGWELAGVKLHTILCPHCSGQ